MSVTQRICHSRLRRSEGRQGCQPGGATLVASSSIVHTRRQPMHPDSLVDTPGFWPLPHARCPTVRPGRPTPAAYAHHSSAKLHARNGAQLEKVVQLGQGSSRRCPSRSPNPRLRADTATLGPSRCYRPQSRHSARLLGRCVVRSSAPPPRAIGVAAACPHVQGWPGGGGRRAKQLLRLRSDGFIMVDVRRP